MLPRRPDYSRRCCRLASGYVGAGEGRVFSRAARRLGATQCRDVSRASFWNTAATKTSRRAASPPHRGAHARLLTEARLELKTQLSAECHRVKTI